MRSQICQTSALSSTLYYRGPCHQMASHFRRRRKSCSYLGISDEPLFQTASLARLVFDILATSIRAESGLHRVSQSTLDARLIQLSASLRVTLDDIMLSTSTAAKDASTSLHADVDANACVDAVPPPPPSLSSSSSIARPDLLKKKKRKASSGPSTAESRCVAWVQVTALIDG